MTSATAASRFGVHAAIGVHRDEFADAQVDDEVHVLRQLRDQLAVRGLTLSGVRRRAVDQDAPARGRVAVGEALDVGQQPALAGTRRPDDAQHVAGGEHQPQVLGLAALVPAAEDRQRSQRLRRLAAQGVDLDGERRDMRERLLAIHAGVGELVVGKAGEPALQRAAGLGAVRVGRDDEVDEGRVTARQFADGLGQQRLGHAGASSKLILRTFPR